MSENGNNKLFEDFPPVSEDQWEEVILRDLKGADYDRKLVWKTVEGIPLRPYYRAEDIKDLSHLKSLPGEFPFVRGKKKLSNDWLVRQDIRVDDHASANLKAIDALMKGAGSIGFILNDETDLKQNDIGLLLENLCLASCEINFICSGDCAGLPEIIDRINISRGGAVSDFHGCVEYDPLGQLLTTGNYPRGEEKSFDIVASMVKYASRMPNFTVINVNAPIFHNSGGSAIDDLAFAMASAAEYLQRLHEYHLQPPLA